MCYGANEMWDMRIHMQGFILKHGQNTGRVGQWQTGITQTRQRVILGQAWVDDRRTISKGLDRRGNPGTRAIILARFKQETEGQGKRVNPENTGRSQNTREHTR